MSVIDVVTAVGAPGEPHIQPGDMVSITYGGVTMYGRACTVLPIEGLAYVQWSAAVASLVDGSLAPHPIDDLRFVDRPAEYLIVTYHISERERYSFVVAGDDVSEDEDAFERAERYTIVARRTSRQTCVAAPAYLDGELTASDEL